jgi:hypothetical protein
MAPKITFTINIIVSKNILDYLVIYYEIEGGNHVLHQWSCSWNILTQDVHHFKTTL